MRTIRILLIAGALALSSQSALAQAAACGPVAKVFAAIKAKFNEVPAFVATIGNGAVLTIAISPTGSWTAVQQENAEIACLVASGEHWMVAPKTSDHDVPTLVPGRDT